MKKWVRRTLSGGWIMAFVISLVACAIEKRPLEGVVLEYGTNRPLANAIVLGSWDKTYASIGDSTTACVHVETGRTDVRGVFRLPSWNNRTPSRMLVYAPRYEHFFPATEVDETQLYVKSYSEGKSQRLRYLKQLEFTARCSNAGTGQKNTLVLLKAMHEEAASLVATRQDQEIADGLLSSIDVIELGYEEGTKKAIERYKSRQK